MNCRPIAIILKDLQLARLAFHSLRSLGLPTGEVEFKGRQLWYELRGVELRRASEGETTAIVDLERYLDRPDLTQQELARIVAFLDGKEQGEGCTRPER